MLIALVLLGVGLLLVAALRHGRSQATPPEEGIRVVRTYEITFDPPLKPSEAPADEKASEQEASAPPSEPPKRERPAPRRAAAARGRLPELGTTPFAVVDVETTGLFPVPDGRDRVLELAIVRLRPDGTVEDEYTTLLNPQRRVAATRVHGITQRQVEGAPFFQDVAGDVGTRLCDAIVVGHNVGFDWRFLDGEFSLAGVELPRMPTICTMSLASRVGAGSRKLGLLCEEFGITLTAHSALGDARATATLLREFMGRCRLSDLELDGVPLSGRSWLPVQPTGLSLPRGTEGDAPTHSLMERLIARLPENGPESDAHARYADLLERALLDRELSAFEIEHLVRTAAECGLSVEHAKRVNRTYLRKLIALAKADGVVTEFEREEASRVAALLGIDNEEVAAELSQTGPALTPQPPATISLLRTQSVCFLGEFASPLDRLVELATSGGLTLRKNLTKTVGLVVVGEGNSERAAGSSARSWNPCHAGTRVRQDDRHASSEGESCRLSRSAPGVRTSSGGRAA
jgi:DNA polymerase-3 subunit epsilon